MTLVTDDFDDFDLVFFIDSRKTYFYFQGTGCARGFLSAMDAAWMFRRMVNGKLNPLEIICERENIYKYVLTYLKVLSYIKLVIIF